MRSGIWVVCTHVARARVDEVGVVPLTYLEVVMAVPLAESMAERRSDTGFGAALRACRTTLGLTQEELAERSGLSVRAIRNLEIGRTERPQQQSVELLATALRLAEDDRTALLAAAGRGRATATGRCELPPDVPALVGRDAVIATLTRVLTTGPAPRLALVSGGPGVGRTALATHVAHRLRDRFPDGQVYADLDRSDGVPMSPEAVLGRVLRSLGAADLPDCPDELAALLRAELAARRVLVVLDNVATEAQVRPLLTGSALSAVLVTSRRGLVTLPGGYPVRVDPLGVDSALMMLGQLAGLDRLRAEPAAARAIVAACACQPLALHIAGTWLVARPDRAVADLAVLLADEHRLLDRLEVADLSVRTSIAAFDRGLRADERHLLRALSHLDATRFTPAALCHHLATPEAVLHDGVERLLHANVVSAAGAGPDGVRHYRVDPMVRRFALEDDGVTRLRAAR
jgi:transcriptional regulator with XRE-family HTH domain